ncbi:DUF2806 domain-containing protein [Enterobacter sp. LM3]|uniref:DUF2806 domain-containing protein n=1 Tax=Enterobacter sp. LM3 TaxID=3384450 RepID=UPI0039863A1A
MSLIDLSLSGLSKPGAKLIEKISDAIGVLYEPTKIRKLAKAEADANRTQLISKLELEGIEKRAVERFLKKESKRQENIESISIQAAMNLNENDNISDINEDWINAFFKECEDINDKEMQTLWARILSEEAKSEGSFSKRTIKLLSTLNKDEANLITYFGRFVWQASILTPILLLDDNGDTDEISFIQLSTLDSLGVIQQGLGYNLTFNGKKGRISYYGIPVSVEFNNESKNEWTMNTGTALLTPIGSELMKICGSTPDMEYFNKVFNHFNKKGSQLNLTIL